MIQSVFYGLTAAFAFIGLVSVLYYLLLLLYRPKGNGKYIVYINDEMHKHEIDNLIYGAHIRNLLLGDLVSDEILVAFCGNDTKILDHVKSSANEYGSVIVLTPEEIEAYFRKENDGTGT